MKKNSPDWRSRQVVYQIMVDRFATTPQRYDTLKSLYQAPRKLLPWTAKPRKGRFLAKSRCWSHELQFWGGDLQGIISHWDYLQDLGINTLYLNPIFKAFTNHKYDTIDYYSIDPAYGTQDDLVKLAKQLHLSGAYLVLDGVFNHTSWRAEWFQQAHLNPSNVYHSFYYFSSQYPCGYRAWADAPNLPELNLENPAVQKQLFWGAQSVLKYYLEVVDGWRLDVAFDLGPELLAKITATVHDLAPENLVIGEIWSYPDGWLRVLDGVMNFYWREIILQMVRGQLGPSQGGRLLADLVQRCGVTALQRSWLILSNHDTPRLKNVLPKFKERQLALVLQFTLPGAPVIYYGEELGLAGGPDPFNRAPMPWHRCTSDNPTLKFYRALISLRHQQPALTEGTFELLPSAEEVLAFCRKTSRLQELVLVVMNFGHQQVRTTLALPEYRLMNRTALRDWHTGQTYTLESGLLTLKLPGQSFRVLVPLIQERSGYTPYKRILI